MSPTHKTSIFIGDVQGCADELLDLLELLEFDSGAHELCFVGDLVNRGPRSLDALRLARDLGADSVLGNHDLHLLGRAAGTRRPKKLDTLDAVLEAPDADELLDWLRRRPLMLFWHDLMVVHAGLHPQWGDPESIAARATASVDWRRDPFEHADLGFATTVRHCDAFGNQPPKKLDHGFDLPSPWASWDRWYDGERTVVFGHWAQRGLVIGERVRGLDSGCVWGGSLTAWIAEENRLVSVPARRAYVQP